MNHDEGLGRDTGGLLPGLILGGPMALLGLITGPLAARSVQELKLLWSRPMRAAVRISGLSREDIEERLREDPRLVPLAVRVLHEAAMTGQQEVLDLLGAALRDGGRHPDQADDIELILSGLARLRPAHTRLLRQLGPEAPQDNGSAITWGPAVVGDRQAMTEDQANRLLFDLASSGFMTMHGAFGGLGFTVNDRGVRLLEVIEALNA